MEGVARDGLDLITRKIGIPIDHGAKRPAQKNSPHKEGGKTVQGYGNHSNAPHQRRHCIDGHRNDPNAHNLDEPVDHLQPAPVTAAHQ
ncbi:MAG: hypothetical protein COB04_14105 [Gammaproteobacteria bacterium]|nr:MAG: hypothetical protein COB04_14105 [Gammaproteobacteria bacterium]